ncbi:MAG: hypothetical protein ORO03_01425, partial [Alphaproteobacteria bacterium]|nr:hypothetical protein [Alphaproteobacteria bacterium]
LFGAGTLLNAFDASTHGYNLGAAMLTILPCLALTCLSFRGEWRRGEWFLVFLALVGFSLAAFIREAIATMGLLVFVGIGAILFGLRLGERKQQMRDHEKSNWLLWLNQGKIYLVFLLLLPIYKIQNFLVWLGGLLYNLPAQRAVGNGSADNFFDWSWLCSLCSGDKTRRWLCRSASKVG